MVCLEDRRIADSIGSAESRREAGRSGNNVAAVRASPLLLWDHLRGGEVRSP
jgi:hypothetical protein